VKVAREKRLSGINIRIINNATRRGQMKKAVILLCVLFMAAPAMALSFDNLELGGQVRLRGYELKNMWDFNKDEDNDNWSVFRSYTSLHTKAKVSDEITGFVKISNQTYGSGTGTGQNTDDNVFVDNAWIQVNNLFGQPVTLTAGRMNLMYGSGFVLFDGQSQFASTSLYFDGVKLGLKLGENALLEGLYFKDEEQKRDNIAEDDITLSGAYLTSKCPVLGNKQELYLLNRRDENLPVAGVKAKKDIWMAGLRISDTLDVGAENEFALNYAGEVAYQFGKFAEFPDFPVMEDIDQAALGYKLDAGFKFKNVPLTPRLFANYTFMEGDDPNTDEKERWDVFYGGWPQFGDLLAWKYVNTPPVWPPNAIADYDENWNEGSTVYGEAVYSNLKIATLGLGFNLTASLSADVSYSLLTVDQPDPGKDDDFGDYYQINMKYAYSPNLGFALYGAMIDPGRAFINDDNAYEFYWETQLRF
jgi:hypothetical protein